MGVGNITRPMPFRTEDDKEALRIVYYKSKTPPHQANLKDDYQKIQEVALSEKQNKVLSNWVKKKQKSTYIQINPEYSNCEILKHWAKNN